MRSGKWTALLCAGAMLLTAAPTGAIGAVTAYAEETTPTSGTCGENLTWTFDESTGTLTISGEGEMTETPWYHLNGQIKAAVIEDGVTSIRWWAFSYCIFLTSVTIPDSVTSIGKGVFAYCSALTSVTIPDSVTSIGEFAFYGCSGLTSVTIPDSVTSIELCAFDFCTTLTSVTIPDSVTSIGLYAFRNCESLTSATILNPDCEIGDYGGTFSNGRDGENYVYSGTVSGYEGSTAQAYAEKYGYTFQSLSAAPVSEPPALEDAAVGDVSGDAKVDASDAADLLIVLAEIGAGGENPLSDAQKAAADADGNGELNAGDAATILQYAAFIGAGGTGTLPDFLKSFA